MGASRNPYSDLSLFPFSASRVMQAIVKEKRAPGLKVTTVAKPSAAPGEVLIAVRHAGVCGTDLHIADWDAWAQGRIKPPVVVGHEFAGEDRKSTRLNSSHGYISYAVFCLKKKKKPIKTFITNIIYAPTAQL